MKEKVQTALVAVIAGALVSLNVIEVVKNLDVQKAREAEARANSIEQATIEDVKKSSFSGLRDFQIEATVNYLISNPKWTIGETGKGNRFIEVKGKVRNSKANDDFMWSAWTSNFETNIKKCIQLSKVKNIDDSTKIQKLKDIVGFLKPEYRSYTTEQLNKEFGKENVAKLHSFYTTMAEMFIEQQSEYKFQFSVVVDPASHKRSDKYLEAWFGQSIDSTTPLISESKRVEIKDLVK